MPNGGAAAVAEAMACNIYRFHLSAISFNALTLTLSKDKSIKDNLDGRAEGRGQFCATADGTTTRVTTTTAVTTLRVTTTTAATTLRVTTTRIATTTRLTTRVATTRRTKLVQNVSLSMN